MSAPIQLDSASRWYGDVIALNNVTLDIDQGVVGLVGPNGAGKTTLLRLVTGQIKPTSGTVLLYGQHAHKTVSVRRKVGYCPEHDRFYEDMTGVAFVTLMTRLYGFTVHEAETRANLVLDQVDLSDTDRKHKRISDYSKGMRQKVKIAQALAHDPEVLVLDEPFIGVDALSRHHLANLVKELGEQGTAVVLSSHILAEVERVTRQFVAINRGRLIAEGNVNEIRALIDQHPHRIEIKCTNARKLASAMVAKSKTPVGLSLENERTLVITTADPNDCYEMLPTTALEAGITLFGLHSPDNNLESVFRYLTKD